MLFVLPAPLRQQGSGRVATERAIHPMAVLIDGVAGSGLPAILQSVVNGMEDKLIALAVLIVVLAYLAS